jgi:hypothetical protein
MGNFYLFITRKATATMDLWLSHVARNSCPLDLWHCCSRRPTILGAQARKGVCPESLHVCVPASTRCFWIPPEVTCIYQAQTKKSSSSRPRSSRGKNPQQCDRGIDEFVDAAASSLSLSLPEPLCSSELAPLPRDAGEVRGPRVHPFAPRAGPQNPSHRKSMSPPAAAAGRPRLGVASLPPLRGVPGRRLRHLQGHPAIPAFLSTLHLRPPQPLPHLRLPRRRQSSHLQLLQSIYLVILKTKPHLQEYQGIVSRMISTLCRSL